MAVTEICVTLTDLAAFLEGSLTGGERDRMVRHLNHCPDCFERYIGAARLLDAIEEEEASAPSAANVNVVAQNLSYDYQNHLWGKWRPSAEAQRLGPTAVQSGRLFSPEQTLVEVAEARASAEKRRARVLLSEAFATLSPEDRLIVMMREQFSVAEIARRFNLEQKPLYRRLERIYASLRSTLKSKGVRREDIADILRNLAHESEESGK